MSNPDLFIEALKSAREKVAELKQQRAALEGQIARWEQTVAALSALREPTFPIDFPRPPQRLSDKPGGLKDQVLHILKAATAPLTVPEIKQRLDQNEYKWANPANALQSIHSVVRRLMEDGGDVFALDSDRDKKTRVAFLWAGNIAR